MAQFYLSLFVTSRYFEYWLFLVTDYGGYGYVVAL